MGCNRKVKPLVSELFSPFSRGGREVQKVTFALDISLQNAIWRQNGFIYRKTKAV